MKLFGCPTCGQIVFFGNVRCERCSDALGYEPSGNTMLSLRPASGAAAGAGWVWVAAAGSRAGSRWKYCGNHVHDVCNWLLAADASDALCRACRHNIAIPDLSVPANVVLWRKMEEAKHQLLYTLLRLGLPLRDRSQDPEGLGFEFLRTDDARTKVMTGHASGLITVGLVEADDAERERRRAALHEPYRTLLGHFRHEVGHWYWDRLVRDSDWHGRFTALFGDASQDYGAALRRHYAEGPPPSFRDTLISAYAASHPWEDFAETWAHYLHMIDTLETGSSWNIVLKPRLDHDKILSTSLDFDVFDPHLAMATIADAWLALSTALNTFNRSMGLSDAYPFVLSPRVIEKLAFIHDLVRAFQS